MLGKLRCSEAEAHQSLALHTYELPREAAPHCHSLGVSHMAWLLGHKPQLRQGPGSSVHVSTAEGRSPLALPTLLPALPYPQPPPTLLPAQSLPVPSLLCSQHRSLRALMH